MPTVGAEFSNSSLPEHWSSCNWSGNNCVTPGSGATVSGGSLHVLGAMASTEATFAPGRSLEFVATFGLAAFQHVGFSDNFQNRWAMFSTKESTTGQLYTRTREGGVEQVKAIGTPGQYTGSPHRYRIQWEAGQVLYFIDGNLVQTDIAVLASGLNAGASDYNSVGPELSVDWLHVSPYSTPGTFTSRVFDAGQAVNWGAITWDRDPAGKHQHRNQRAHRRHPDAGRHLELVHADRHQRGEHSRQLALRAVPGAACHGRRQRRPRP